MAKLHEILAAEGTAKTQADTTRADLMNTFDKKKHLFGEELQTFVPLGEGAEPIEEKHSDLQSTVRTELRWISDIWSRALDVAYMIAETNMGARADVVLENGRKIMENVPATALLELEKRAGEIHAFVKTLPTLDPAKGFKPDPDRGTGIYVAREVMKIRTKKVQTVVVLYQATEKHPAQVQLVPEDVPIGTIRAQEWSGMITPSEKADMLERAEQLRRAFKTARARANEAVVTETKVGKTLLDFVFGG